MTVRMTPGTTRHAAALKFGAELTKAMATRGVGQRQVYLAAKVSRASVVEFRHGRNLPTTEVARRMADALSWPSLLTIVEAARTGACATCQAPIRLDTGTRRLYCSVACRSVANVLGRPTDRQASAAARLDAVEGALVAHRDAIAAMCAGCEPEGRCRDAGCPLRPVSPLRMHTGLDADTARPAAGRWGTPEERVRWSEHMRRKHAAGEMGDNRGRMLAIWEGMTPEQRAERGRRISEGRRKAMRPTA